MSGLTFKFVQENVCMNPTSPAGHPQFTLTSYLLDGSYRKSKSTTYLDTIKDSNRRDLNIDVNDLSPSESYISHYEKDALVFDYFEVPADPATVHENRRLHETILSFVPDGKQSVLDIGCGNAWAAAALARHAQVFISLDIASENLIKAKQLVPAANHVAVRGDVINLPFKSNSIDTIISAEVIEHVHDTKAYLDSIIRVLKPGGRAILSTPYNETIQYSLCIHCNNETPLHAHLHSFVESSLDKYIAAQANISLRALTVSNKVLVFARTHPFMKRLPYKAWKFVDGIANKIIKKPLRLIYVLDKH